MNLNFTAEELAFQQEVRDFLANNLPAHIVEGTANNSSVFVEKDIALEWQAILVEKGWAVPQWPEEHGGTGWTPTQKYIFSKECYDAGAPMLIPLGLLMLAPVIMAFGTQEQKAQYLPKILSGEHYWCQGYSEPSSGSDLASLKLRAEADGDDYIVNGSKIWTSYCNHADYIFLLVRTDPDSSRIYMAATAPDAEDGTEDGRSEIGAIYALDLIDDGNGGLDIAIANRDSNNVSMYMNQNGAAGPCSGADFAEPFGQLDFFDVSAFLSAFNAMDVSADLNADGTWNFFDVSAFLNTYSAGCP